MAKYDITNIRPPVHVNEKLLEYPSADECIYSKVPKQLYSHNKSCGINMTILHKWICHLEQNNQLKVLIKDYLKQNPNGLNILTSIDKRTYGGCTVTPFMLLFAIIWKDQGTFVKMLDFFLKYSIDPKIVDCNGDTALFYAVTFKFPAEIIVKLLKHGFDINHVNNKGFGLVNHILDNTHPNNYSFYEHDLLPLLHEHGLRIKKTENPIMFALQNLHSGHVISILDKRYNARVSDKNSNGRTCLDVLLANRIQYKKNPYVFFHDLKILLDRNIDVNNSISCCNGKKINAVSILKEDYRESSNENRKMIIKIFEQLLATGKLEYTIACTRESDETDKVFDKMVAYYLYNRNVTLNERFGAKIILPLIIIFTLLWIFAKRFIL